MLTEKETEDILTQFFVECLKYQKTQTKNEDEAFEKAIEDIDKIQFDPFSPQGEKLSIDGKQRFLGQKRMSRQQ